MANEKSQGRAEAARETAPGLQKQVTVPNTDPTKPAWTGRKADYLNDKANLQAQGYILPDDDDTAGSEVPPSGSNPTT